MMTDLILQPVGEENSHLPLLSSRDCTQTLAPISQGNLRRTVNGRLVHTGMPHHTKYQSVIKGEDKVPPALENIWKGAEFMVGCLPCLTQPISNGLELELTRDPVANSVMLINEGGEEFEPSSVLERRVMLTGENGICFISYRPLLHMRTVDFHLTTNEWGKNNGWRLDLEEV